VTCFGYQKARDQVLGRGVVAGGVFEIEGLGCTCECCGDDLVASDCMGLAGGGFDPGKDLSKCQLCGPLRWFHFCRVMDAVIAKARAFGMADERQQLVHLRPLQFRDKVRERDGLLRTFVLGIGSREAIRV